MLDHNDPRCPHRCLDCLIVGGKRPSRLYPYWMMESEPRWWGNHESSLVFFDCLTLLGAIPIQNRGQGPPEYFHRTYLSLTEALPMQNRR